MEEKSVRSDEISAKKYNRMLTEPVGKLVATLAIPTVISMLITAIYNMADTFFVSRLGTSASGAVGIVFAVMAIIQAVGFCFGMGAQSIISRMLGRKDYEGAAMIAASAVIGVVVFCSVLLVLGIVFNDGLMMLLGATPTILPYAKAYASYIFIGAPIMGAAVVMNNILRSEGHAAFSMIALTSGGILNIALDPIFIFAFNLGTAGAAIATCLSQVVSFLIFVQFFARKKSIVQLNLKKTSKKLKTYIDIFTNGLPSLARQSLASVATMILNNTAAVYGDAAIAGVSITQRIIIFAASVMIGIGQGYSPVSGYNYGAQRFDRVRAAFVFTVKFGFYIFLPSAALIFIFAPNIISLFIDDAEVIVIGAAALRFQAVALPLHSLIVSSNMLMQSTGKRLAATILSSARNGIFFIPVILVLPLLYGLIGVESAQTCADILTAIFSIPFIMYFMKNLPKSASSARC